MHLLWKIISSLRTNKLSIYLNASKTAVFILFFYMFFLIAYTGLMLPRRYEPRGHYYE
uniref:Uncharacterized protein n=1 Tax=Anguilla anguilla TaxID=7936 RepID=A0A0E9WH23_ANGAN